MSVKKDILWRVGLVYFTMLLVGIAILGRVVYIQVVQGSYWKEKSRVLTLKDITIEPNRGDIYAKDMRLLATSMPYYEIRMDMKAEGLTDGLFYRGLDSLSRSLSWLFKDKPASTYKAELISARKQGKRFHLVKRRVSYTELKKLKEFPVFKLGQHKGGLIYVQDNLRFMPHGGLAARTIGYTTKSESGNVVGIEGGYDEYLRGVKGIRLMQKLSGGAWMPVSTSNEIDPKDGYDLVTTIDVNIQDVAESALRAQLEKHNAHHGCAVLMEVETGAIRAMSNLERDEYGRYRELYNYAVGESTEPGSTFKLASIMNALEDGFVQLQDTFDTGDGVVYYYGKRLSDSGDEGLGVITVKQIFEHSSNVGITKIITRFYKGREKQFIDRLYKMRLNEKLDLDIRGEGIPEIKYPGDKYWSGLSLPMMSIGYEVRITPLQILSFYNAVANNGKMVKPRLSEEILHHGQTVKKFNTEVLNPSICSKSTLKKTRVMLEGVVENGSARNLRNANFKIAGKTGTAQIARSSEGYRSGGGVSYQASFVGYFPADNPKYSCIVVVNSPSNNVYYGNLVAGPVFKEIADKVYSAGFEMHKDDVLVASDLKASAPYTKSGYLPEIEKVFQELGIEQEKKSPGGTWVNSRSTSEKVELTNRTVNPALVPNVVDMGLKDALYLLENAGLRVVVRGRGTVRKQSIAPGTRVRDGESIVLEMSFS